MLIVCCVQVPKLPALSMMLNAGTLECYQKLIESHGTTIPYKPTQNKNLVFLHTTPSAEASVTSRTYSTRTSCRSSPKRAEAAAFSSASAVEAHGQAPSLRFGRRNRAGNGIFHSPKPGSRSCKLQRHQ